MNSVERAASVNEVLSTLTDDEVADAVAFVVAQRAKADARRRATPKLDENGTWFFVVDLPSVDGKRRQAKRRGFATHNAAQTALDELERLHWRVT